MDDKELNILRISAEKAQKNLDQMAVQSENLQNIISIVESFLKNKKLICYGGTAINELIPDKDKFYDRSTTIVDYDFFSFNAMTHAKQLANLYVRKGYKDVEAKVGLHIGTYKVFVDFIPVADITQIPKELFDTLKKNAIEIDEIYYCPPNYLRMSMYLELSRPHGDVSRWEKVYKRLQLLNKYYPIKGFNCKRFRKRFEDTKHHDFYNIVKQTAINIGVVFFGSFARNQYGKKKFYGGPFFDVLSENPENTAIIIKENLISSGAKNVKIIYHESPHNNIPELYNVSINNINYISIYQTIACHNYNTININKQSVRIATIDTILSLYLAFLYTDDELYDVERILCICEYIFNIANKKTNKGVKTRFTIKCIGKQKNAIDMRAEKLKKFHELKNKRGTKEFEQYFLRYSPFYDKPKTKKRKRKKIKIKNKN